MAVNRVNDPRYYAQIDGEKLREYLRKRGIGVSELSGKLRRNVSFVTQSCQRGSMRLRDYEFMCDILGCEYDLFLKDTKEETPVAPETDTASETSAVDFSEIVSELSKINETLENVGRVMLAMLEKF